MFTQKAITEALLLCENKRNRLREVSQLVKEWEADLEKEDNALRALSQVSHAAEGYERRAKEVQLQLPGMALHQIIEVVSSPKTKGRKRKDGKKPDVQVMEEVFRAHGPLHVTDLIPIAQPLGVSFAGKKKPTVMARDKLTGSKRFHLFGKNVWGLPGQELPHQNGHDAEQPIPANEAILP